MLSGVMKFFRRQIVAAVVATSFAAGLNVYATVATLGLLAHAGVSGTCRRRSEFWPAGG